MRPIYTKPPKSKSDPGLGDVTLDSKLFNEIGVNNRDYYNAAKGRSEVIAEEIRELASREGEWTDADEKRWTELNKRYDEEKDLVKKFGFYKNHESVFDEDGYPKVRTEGTHWSDAGEDPIEVNREVRGLRNGERLSTGAPVPYGLGHFVRGMLRGAQNDLEERALAEGTDSAGGYTVPVALANDLIDRLRAQSVAFRGGAEVIPLSSMTNKVAKLATDPTVSWRDEGASVGESSPTFSAITFTPRSAATIIKISRELLEDNIINLTMALRQALAAAFASEVDRVALYGSATAPEPKGVKNVTGIGQVVMGANGAALTDYDPILDGWLELAQDNAGPATAAIMAPRTQVGFGKLKATDNQPLMRPEMIRDLPFLSTTHIPVDETQGTANNASTILVGDYSQLKIGMRSELRLQVLNERFADNLQVGLLAYMRMDCQVFHPESFAEVIGVIPA